MLFPCNFTNQAALQDSEAWSDYFTTERCETEGFQFQLEELSVNQESTSQEVTPQDYGFHDGDITMMKCSRTMSSLPCKSSVTALFFGSGREAGGEAYITQKNLLPTPAVPDSGAHLRFCELPMYCSPQSLFGGMKYDNSSVDHIPNLTVLSSHTSTHSSHKTNTERQVTPNSPAPQHCEKKKLKPKYRKKMVIGLHDATAAEQKFPESAELLVSLLSGVFYTQDAMSVMLKPKLRSPNENCHKNTFVSRFMAVQQNKNMVRVVMKLLSRDLNRVIFVFFC